MTQAPRGFSGSWLELYGEHIEPNLPDVEVAVQAHRWMLEYCDERDPVFPVRRVKGAVRREVYRTSDGTQFAPCDNSPAWVMHASLMYRRFSSYAAVRRMMYAMPSHMFDIAKAQVGPTANQLDWYMAHVCPAKNRDTNWEAWSRAEVERRFFLTLHPCNLFLAPGRNNREMGEDRRVINFIAAKYAVRYQEIWAEFLTRVSPATPGESDFGSTLAVAPAVQPTAIKVVAALPGVPGLGVAVSYAASRLTFKRDQIEPMGWDEAFEVVTPMGRYRFTKREFYKAFPNVVVTPSYRNRGVYHNEKLHLKAEKFRVG